LIESEAACDQLVPGEPRESRHLDEVAHWVTVYEELIQFLSKHEFPLTTERYRQRLDFWQQRLYDLQQPLDVDSPANR
jgi:hypothetical protein